MGFLGAIVSGASALLGGGSKPKAATKTATPTTTSPATNPSASAFEYYAYLAANQNTQFNTSLLYGSGQQQTTTLALANLGATSAAGERSQMTTYVVLGVVMVGVAGLVALSRR